VHNRKKHIKTTKRVLNIRAWKRHTKWSHFDSSALDYFVTGNELGNLTWSVIRMKFVRKVHWKRNRCIYWENVQHRVRIVTTSTVKTLQDLHWECSHGSCKMYFELMPKDFSVWTVYLICHRHVFFITSVSISLLLVLISHKMCFFQYPLY